MIKVTLFRSQGDLTGFEISGHAESGPYGHDLVCAAVSTASIGAVNAIAKLCDFEPDVKQAGEEGGYLKVMLPEGLPDEASYKAKLLLEGMQVTLESIEHEHHQYISISHR
ncbi:ribosomal-processing cysteine protease Prp [Halobacillus litoralis]|uniref:ribosomal-processing cysteine protease Prp n=1 Tax=Halobacillus litoralis TaxID=45668 RepID=UPI001CD3C6C6|nr:ribosomal-processing cysteine protease Prp [Halobacillus litoralis]MCA0969944.1 ribosomal-processing cysteine protease Prp [Halobacillus litoralis]